MTLLWKLTILENEKIVFIFRSAALKQLFTIKILYYIVASKYLLKLLLTSKAYCNSGQRDMGWSIPPRKLHAS